MDLRPLLLSFGMVVLPLPASPAATPNIVVLLADDLGYGELRCLNPAGRIATPQLDRLASQGMVFTDAHSGSAVCTPTRYGLLTGRYAWRTRLQQGVLTGGESLIAEAQLTLPDLLRQKGYHTCLIGKWHLGMWFDGKASAHDKLPRGTKVTQGPIDRGGFDEFHGFHHARQMGLWIDNHEVTGNPKPVEMLPLLTAKAVEYIGSRKGKEQPFFLYVPWNSPHSPVAPSPDWQGKSGINAHADFVMQTDDSCGQILQALEANGLRENTLVFFSADNGTSPQTCGLEELTRAGHAPSGPFRGMKADFWDGGHRVPLIASWPGKIKPGSTNAQLVCLNDLYATLAGLTGQSYPAKEGVDSISFLASLLGEKAAHPRENLIHHSISGMFAIRQGPWKLLFAGGSGGWSKPTPAEAARKGLPSVQLYRIEQDPGETNNLHQEHPEKVQELRALLEMHIADGRSTPGPKQKNDVANVIIDKQPKRK